MDRIHPTVHPLYLLHPYQGCKDTQDTKYHKQIFGCLKKGCMARIFTPNKIFHGRLLLLLWFVCLCVWLHIRRMNHCDEIQVMKLQVSRPNCVYCVLPEWAAVGKQQALGNRADFIQIIMTPMVKIFWTFLDGFKINQQTKYHIYLHKVKSIVLVRFVLTSVFIYYNKNRFKCYKKHLKGSYCCSCV